ncbi:MAG: L-seryl-tRNA(Sec) selenium transferase [Planctomycetes bacterium]|nr:L-seryl-tRNA(Sec) selenium transferase [Planctomycetota bacterium]
MTALLNAAASLPALASHSQSVVTNVLREIVSGFRERVRSGPIAGMDFSLGAVLDATVSHLRSRGTRRLSRVINATGIVLHTGLGRSVLPVEAVERLSNVASGYCGLEIDLETGDRGLRGGYVEELLRELTGAEAALVVNNNAAATMLALRALAQGREVIVSRGQLIEIGGSYRLPEVMSAGGAVLREVGTTNKTHLRDYERAINVRTGLIMHVHTSNYRVVGFSESPTAAQLAQLAHDRKLPMFDDLGSGALMDDELWRSANEPTVAASLRAGSDVIGFSGDKLLGGPQAGILLGRRDTIERLRKDPMARALRVGKLTMAALEAVLELYQDPAAARRRIPLLARLWESADALTQSATELAAMLGAACPGERFEVRADESFAGGGSLPAFGFPTATVRWVPTRGSLDGVARALRLSEPAVLARLNEGAIVFDVRAMREEEFGEVVGAVARSIQDT